jgi:hypothetical protein
MSAIDSSLATQVLRFVQVAGAFSKKANEQLSIKQAAEKRAAALVPSLVQLMQQNNLIAENQKSAAEQMLGDHEQSLVLLKNAIDKLATLKQASAVKSARDLGQPDGSLSDAGNASDPQRSLSSPFVGARTSEKKASDVAFMKGLGLPV